MRSHPFLSALILPAIIALALASGEAASSAAPAPDLKIAVFDQQPAGGEGARIEGLLKGLRSQDYDVRRIADLQPIGLCVFDIVYLSDMYSPGSVHEDWRKSLADYVQAGGSVLQTWHHHLFREVGVGVQRICGSRPMYVRTGHPAVEGMADFQASYSDHIFGHIGADKMDTTEELAAQIMLTRQAGAAGFVGSAYQPNHTSQLFMPFKEPRP